MLFNKNAVVFEQLYWLTIYFTVTKKSNSFIYVCMSRAGLGQSIRELIERTKNLIDLIYGSLLHTRIVQSPFQALIDQSR